MPKCRKCAVLPPTANCKVKHAGQCFVGDTPVRWEGDTGFELKALEDVGLGDGVQTFDAGERVGERGPRRLFAASMDRAVWLRQERGDGCWTEVGLIRSRIWLEKHGATRVGARVDLKLPEMGASGLFEVVAVEPCPPIRARAGWVVTGVFCHGAGRVFDLWLEGEREPLGVTAGHPIWSADRRAWVPAGALVAGECVLGVNGPVRVLRTDERGDEPVLTLEVDGGPRRWATTVRRADGSRTGLLAVAVAACGAGGISVAPFGGVGEHGAYWNAVDTAACAAGARFRVSPIRTPGGGSGAGVVGRVAGAVADR